MRFAQEIVELVCDEYACRGSEFETDCDDDRLTLPNARKELATNIALVSKAFNVAATRVIWEWVVIRRIDDLVNIATCGSKKFGERTRRLHIEMDLRGTILSEEMYDERKVVEILKNMAHLQVLLFDNAFDPPAHPWAVVPLMPEVIEAIVRCKTIVRLELLSTTEPLQAFDFLRLAHECPGLKTVVICASTGVSGGRGIRLPSSYSPPPQATVFPALVRLSMGSPGVRYLPELLPFLGEDDSVELQALRRLDIRYLSRTLDNDGTLKFIERNGPALRTLGWVVERKLPSSWLGHLTNVTTLILTLRSTDTGGQGAIRWRSPSVEVVVLEPEHTFIVPSDTHATWLCLLQRILSQRSAKLKEIIVQKVDITLNEDLRAKIVAGIGAGLKGTGPALWFGGVRIA